MYKVKENVYRSTILKDFYTFSLHYFTERHRIFIGQSSSLKISQKARDRKASPIHSGSTASLLRHLEVRSEYLEYTKSQKNYP